MLEYFYPMLNLITCGKDFLQEQKQQVLLWFPHLVGVPRPRLKRCKAVRKKKTDLVQNVFLILNDDTADLANP